MASPFPSGSFAIPELDKANKQVAQKSVKNTANFLEICGNRKLITCQRWRRGDVAAQDAKFAGEVLQFFQRRLSLCRIGRGHQVEIETIFEWMADNRAAFDFDEINP